MPLLSVIIPTYNRATLLAEAIDLVRSQSFTNYELIVVDDGSTDDTPAMLARYAQERPTENFRMLRQANAGPGAARNLAISQASGEYCVFLDSDDVLYPWSLTAIAEVLTKNGHPSLVIGRSEKFTTINELVGAVPGPLEISVWQDFYAYALKFYLGATGAMVARTELLRKAGGFLPDRIVGEDADLMLRLGLTPNTIRLEEPAMYGYRVHPENFTGNQQRWYRGGCELIRRYRGGAYPGGRARAADIEKLLAHNTAYFSLVCLYLGGRWSCLRLYLKIFIWQLHNRRYSYLLKTPVRMMLSVIGQYPRGLKTVGPRLRP